MEIADFKDITYTKDEHGVVTLVFNTPHRKNALSGVTFVEIWWATEHFKNDDTAHAMILTGAEVAELPKEKQAYSSGGYFSPDAFEGVPQEILDQIDPNDVAQKKGTLQMFQCDKPILAAVNGLAIGGAATLTLACADQVYMSEYAWMDFPFARLGIAAELASTWFLPRLLGFQQAKELLFFPERITAEKALELGLVNRVVPHEELMAFTREQALKLIPPRGAGQSIRAMKRAVNEPHVESLARSLDLENEALGKLFRSQDFAEGVAARIEKRAPVFQGK